MIHLGNHPEVTLCIRCGRWAAKQASEIDDRARTAPWTMARDRLRMARRSVVRRSLHNAPIIGTPLRWLGRYLP